MSFEAPITAPAGVPRVANGKNYGETEIYRESDIDSEAAIDVEPISTKSRCRYEDGVNSEAKNRYKAPIGGESDIVDPSILINGHVLASFSTTAEGLKGVCRLFAPNGRGLVSDGLGISDGLGSDASTSRDGLELDVSSGLGLDVSSGLGLDAAVGLGLDVSRGLGLDAWAVRLGLDASAVALGLGSSGVLGLDVSTGLELDVLSGLGLDVSRGLGLDAWAVRLGLVASAVALGLGISIGLRLDASAVALGLGSSGVLGLDVSTGLELDVLSGLGLDSSAVGLGFGASGVLGLDASAVGLGPDASAIGLRLGASSGSLCNLEANTGRYDLQKRPRAVAHRIRVEEEPMDSADPVSYREAIAHPRFDQKWSDPVDEELRSLTENSTWDYVGLEDVPAGFTPISSKWVFKTKELPGGGIQYKARLVIQKSIKWMFSPPS